MRRSEWHTIESDCEYKQAWWPSGTSKPNYIMIRHDQPGYWIVVGWHGDFDSCDAVHGPFDTSEEAEATFRLMGLWP